MAGAKSDRAEVYFVALARLPFTDSRWSPGLRLGTLLRADAAAPPRGVVRDDHAAPRGWSMAPGSSSTTIGGCHGMSDRSEAGRLSKASTSPSFSPALFLRTCKKKTKRRN